MVVARFPMSRAKGGIPVRFSCPSCVAVNRCPDKCAGMTIICRKCRTQINVPEMPGRVQTRSWIASRGWQGVVAVGVLAVAGFVTSLAILLVSGARGPVGDSNDTKGERRRKVELGTVVQLRWDAALTAPGGYYRLSSPRATLAPDGQAARPLAVQVEDHPWPASLVGEADVPPPRAVAQFRVHLALPSDESLHGLKAAVRFHATLQCLHQPQPGLPLAVATREIERRQPLLLAGPQGPLSGRQGASARRLLRWAVFGFAVVMLAVGLGVLVFRQKLVTIMCPDCGRAAPAYYTHERGDYKVTACPHSNAGALE